MLRKLFLGAVMVLGVGLLSGAVAGQNNCLGSKSACDAANKAASQGPYRGQKAPTTEPMVCLYALSDRPTELVLVNGPSPVGTAILRWRPSAVVWRAWSRDPRLAVGEICIPERLLSGRSAVTLCNGTRVGEGNHSTWRSGHISYLLNVRRIRSGDPACLLGKGPCGAYGL